MLGDQFNNYLVIILIVAALISLALGEYLAGAVVAPMRPFMTQGMLDGTGGAVRVGRADRPSG